MAANYAICMEDWNIGNENGNNLYKLSKFLQVHHFYPVKHYHFTRTISPLFHYPIWDETPKF